MSPIPLGILAASGAVAAGSFDLLETQVLASAQAAVEFTNLDTKYASDYKHLHVRAVFKGTGASNQSLKIRYNGDTANNYAQHALFANGSAVNSGNAPGVNFNTFGETGTLSNSFAAAVVDILDPFETTKNTTLRSLTGTSETLKRIDLHSGVWLSTAPITSINLFLLSGTTLAQYSRFSLYGIRAA